MSKIYPGSVPEFRILRKEDKTEVLQVRYVNTAVKYVGQWQNVPIIEETEQ